MTNRQALLESALASLQDKGYASTTARDIANGAGVSLGAIGYHYRTVQELLDAADGPWSGPSTRRLAETTAGRVLLGLLRLPDGDFARDTVVDWIGSGPVRDPADGRAVPASRWDTLSREAGIVTGLAQWNERLARLSRHLAADLAATDDDELSEGARRHREADQLATGLRSPLRRVGIHAPKDG